MYPVILSSVQFSRSVKSNSLRPHELQHARPPCPSPTPRVHPNPCPSSRGCHPTISSSVVPLSSCPQSFPASGSFQMSQLFTSVGQSTGVSALASVLPMNTQDWSPLGWSGWISFLWLSGILLSHKENEIIPFAVTWMGLEIIILTEVRQRKTNIWYHLHVKSNFKTI